MVDYVYVSLFKMEFFRKGARYFKVFYVLLNNIFTEMSGDILYFSYCQQIHENTKINNESSVNPKRDKSSSSEPQSSIVVQKLLKPHQ